MLKFFVSASTMGFAGLPWIIILAILTYMIGRKLSCLMISVASLAGFIIFYCSASVTHLLICQIVQGPLAASQTITSYFITSEYISPRFRGVFFTVQVASLFWGIWVANAIGTFMHWKFIGLVGIMCSLYSTTNAMICPESPYWLSIRGRLGECAKCHRWLKGSDKDSEKELIDLMELQNNTGSKSLLPSLKEHMKDFCRTMYLPEIYKSLGFCFLVMSTYHFCGKIVCTMYSIDIVKKITGSMHAAYVGMLLMDGVSVIGMYCGCFLPKYLKRRTWCISAFSIAATITLIISLYLYLIELNVINENIYVTITLLMCFSLAVSIGPLSISAVLLGEFLPLKSRSAYICILSFYAKLILSIMLKTTPYIFKRLNIHGTFLMFGIFSSIGLFLFYKYLPETKDKTLIEISEILKGPKGDVDESKELMLTKVFDDGNVIAVDKAT